MLDIGGWCGTLVPRSTYMSKRPSSRPPVSAEDVGQFYAKYKAPANEDFPEGVPPEKIMSLFQDMKITGDVIKPF